MGGLLGGPSTPSAPEPKPEPPAPKETATVVKEAGSSNLAAEKKKKTKVDLRIKRDSLAGGTGSTGSGLNI